MQGKFAEIEASLKKAKDSVSLLEREIADLDADPKITEEETAQVQVEKNVHKNF